MFGALLTPVTLVIAVAQTAQHLQLGVKSYQKENGFKTRFTTLKLNVSGKTTDRDGSLLVRVTTTDGRDGSIHSQAKLDRVLNQVGGIESRGSLEVLNSQASQSNEILMDVSRESELWSALKIRDETIESTIIENNIHTHPPIKQFQRARI